MTNTPCQDQVLCQRFASDTVVAALADGAGSAKYSHYGAWLVVKRASELVDRHFDEAFGSEERRATFAQKLIGHLQKNLQQLALLGINLTSEEREQNSEQRSELLVPCELQDLSSTLLLVAVKKNRYIALHLGDGVIGAELTQGNRSKLRVLSKPSNGEFSNETFFVTLAQATQKTRVITGSTEGWPWRISGFILMSDGPEAALYSKRQKTLAPACKKLFAANAKLEQSTMDEQLSCAIRDVIQKRTDDDCSIAIMSRG